MTVFRDERRGGKWSFDFWANKVRYRGYCVDPKTGEPAKSRSRALEAEAAEKIKARAGAGIAKAGNRPGAFSLAQALDLHLGSLTGKSALYVANQEAYARDLLGWFGVSDAIANVTKERVEAYKKWAIGQPLRVWKGGPGDDRQGKKRDRRDPKWWGLSKTKKRSPATVNHYLDCLRSALDEAHHARDPATGAPMLPFPPEVKALPEPRRVPRPIPDAELAKRRATLPPWAREAADLARLFGLRLSECLKVTIDHLDHDRRGLRFDGEDVKSRRDEFADGGSIGWELLKRLAAQARRRKVRHLITWPGREHWKAVARGEKPEGLAWLPLKTIRRSWRTSAKLAGIEAPHGFHKIRARAITEVAKVAPTPIAQKFARHAHITTTEPYIGVASDEVAQAVDRAQRANTGILRAIAGGRR